MRMLTVGTSDFKARVRAVAFAAVCVASGCATAGLMLKVDTWTLDERLRVVLGGGGNSTVMVAGRDVTVTDVKFGPAARRLRHGLEVDLGHRVRQVMLTHAHWDHAAGLTQFANANAVWVHPNARRALEREGVRAPFVDVHSQVRIWVGDEDVRLMHVGVGHTDGDLVAFLPKRRLLIAGDVLNNGFEPFGDPAYGGDIAQFRTTVQALLALDFDTVIPGHGDVMPRAAVERRLAYLTSLEDAVQEALRAGWTEDVAAQRITLDDYDDLKPMFPLVTRAKNVRALYRAFANHSAKVQVDAGPH